MASLNKVCLIGNLGRDPEVRSFPNGGQVANVSIACTDKWKDKQTGEAKEHTEWVTLVFNDKLAEIAGKYLTKGSQIYVEGQLRARKWTDDQGIEKYRTDVRVQSMQMLGGKPNGEQQAAPRSSAPHSAPRSAPSPAPAGGGGFEDMDDDIPFANPLRSRALCLAS